MAATKQRTRVKTRTRRHVATLGVLFAGFVLPAVFTSATHQPGFFTKASTDVRVSGNSVFRPNASRIVTQSSSRETANIIAPECGSAKPEHAPNECGTQQWKGYSETNPAAAAWLAIANTSDRSCTVTITQLELSDVVDGKRIVLSSNINGVQLLTDGTDSDSWGNYLRDIAPGSTFIIPPSLHGYVHPFGSMVRVPDNATMLTITLAATISSGCALSGGIDTFEEFATPNTNPPYTKNGSTTDFIKEALKTPWVTKTVNSSAPISFSISRLPRSQRTGWEKEN